MRSPEGFEKDEIKKHLTKLGTWFFCPYMAGFGVSGVPDIIGCANSAFFSIEVKREGKEPTAIQWRRINEIEAAGGKAFWGTAQKVIEEFEQWISGTTSSAIS